LDAGLHFVDVNLSSSVIGSGQHFGLSGRFGGLESSILSFLFDLLLLGGLFGFFLGNHRLIVLLGILQLLLLAQGSFVFLLGEALGSSSLLDHATEDALVMGLMGLSEADS